MLFKQLLHIVLNKDWIGVQIIAQYFSKTYWADPG